MSEVTLTIDGRSVTAEQGTTVLEAARRGGRRHTHSLSRRGRRSLRRLPALHRGDHQGGPFAARGVVLLSGRGRTRRADRVRIRGQGPQAHPRDAAGARPRHANAAGSTARDTGSRADKFGRGPELLHPLRPMRQLLRRGQGKARHRLHRQRGGSAGHVLAGGGRRECPELRRLLRALPDGGDGPRTTASPACPISPERPAAEWGSDWARVPRLAVLRRSTGGDTAIRSGRAPSVRSGPGVESVVVARGNLVWCEASVRSCSASRTGGRAALPSRSGRVADAGERGSRYHELPFEAARRGRRCRRRSTSTRRSC